MQSLCPEAYKVLRTINGAAIKYLNVHLFRDITYHVSG